MKTIVIKYCHTSPLAVSLYVPIKVCPCFCHWLPLDIHKYILSSIQVSNHMPSNRREIFWLITLLYNKHTCLYSLHVYLIYSSPKHLTLLHNMCSFIWLQPAYPNMTYALWNERFYLFYLFGVVRLLPGTQLTLNIFWISKTSHEQHWNDFFFSWRTYLGYMFLISQVSRKDLWRSSSLALPTILNRWAASHSLHIKNNGKLLFSELEYFNMKVLPHN